LGIEDKKTPRPHFLLRQGYGGQVVRAPLSRGDFSRRNAHIENTGCDLKTASAVLEKTKQKRAGFHPPFLYHFKQYY